MYNKQRRNSVQFWARRNESGIHQAFKVAIRKLKKIRLCAGPWLEDVIISDLTIIPESRIYYSTCS